jgi:NADH:ubiquinone oxidoreductase subunit 6 (subunit J)
MSPASLAQFLFIVVTPLVVVAGAVVTLFAIGALFDALEHQDELSERVQALFRRPLQAAKDPGKDHYYKPYWTSPR